MVLRLTFLFAVLSSGLAGGAPAQQTDPHAIYENNCGGCHAAHAGEFVTENTVLNSEGKLVGVVSGRSVADFLRRGHGRLTAAEIEILLDHFLSIEQTGRLFLEKCRICHDRAVRLARLKLILQDGELHGRYSGQPTANFLMAHGRLAPEDIPIIIDMLKRQLTER